MFATAYAFENIFRINDGVSLAESMNVNSVGHVKNMRHVLDYKNDR